MVFLRLGGRLNGPGGLVHIDINHKPQQNNAWRILSPMGQLMSVDAFFYRTARGVNSVRLWVFCVLVLGWCAASQARPFVFGYAVWWVPQAETIRAMPHVDRIKFIEVRIDAEGRLPERHGWPQQWQALRDAAATHGVPIDVALTQFSLADFNALFGDPNRIQRLTQEALKLADDPAVAGIHLDVEMVGTVNAKAALRYKAFVLDMAQKLKAKQPARLLGVFFNYGAERQIYDAATLAVADHVILQGYDAHWLNSEVAGPLAPLGGPDAVTWTGMLATARSLGLPPQRLLMGFPTYGHEWKVQPCSPRGLRKAPGETTSFASVSYPQAPQLRHSVVERVLAHGLQYDPETGSAHYRIDAPDGSCVVGWFEDWWTLHRKLDWMEQEKLAGLSFFPLGYDGADLVAQAARRFRAAGAAP